MLQSSPQRFIRLITIHNLSHIRCLNSDVNAENLLVNELGIQADIAKDLIVKHAIDNIEPIKLHDTIQFIKKQRYKPQDVIKNPRIFKQCGRKTWQNYYNYFTECGCSSVPISNILNFRRIRYTQIGELKEEGIIPYNAVVADNLVKQLDEPIPEKDISDLRNDVHTLSFVHRAVTHRYLMNKLGARDDDLEMISRLHSYIYNKSLKTFCENVNLALDLGYTPSRIIRNAYILQTDPDVTKTTLQLLPVFLNCNMKQEMKKWPKLVGISIAQINHTYDILKKFDISDDYISNAMNIFTLSPVTVEERLNDIKSTPETRVLMNNPNILQLIIHYHRAKSRLQFLHKIRLKCTSLFVIGFDATIFDNYVKEGKDVNKQQEANIFLCSLLNCTKNDVDVNFKKHPYYLYVPFVDIEKTFYFLKKRRFEDAQIIKALSILLYPKEKIEQVLNIIKGDHYLSTHKPRANKSQILNLALYYLERDHHFNGNGIWQVNEDYVQTLQ